MNRNDTINRTLNEMRIAIGEMPVIYKPVDERELPVKDRLFGDRRPDVLKTQDDNV